MQRSIEISVGEYYHIYNRGVEKRDIFLDERDRERFVKLLYLANGEKPFSFRAIQGLPLASIDVGEKKVAIIAYVLMPNHFHLLLKEIVDGGISGFMEKFLTAYAMYFNKKYERVGALFQGTFKAKHIEHDEYLKYLFAYIHLNPIKLLEPRWRELGIHDKKGAEQYLDKYRFSSYLDYIGVERTERLILTKEEAPEYFADTYEFKDFLRDWLKYEDEA